MYFPVQKYTALNKSVCTSFKSCGYILRPRASPGLWLVPLVPVSLIASLWKHSYLNNNNVPVSNSYFLTTVVSFGLLISTILYVLRFFPKTGFWIRDLNVLFIFPAIGTLLLLLHAQNVSYGFQAYKPESLWFKKRCGLSRVAQIFSGFVLSLAGGVLSSYGILAGLPSLLTVAPGCFTVGEAVVIVHAIVLFLFSSIVNLSHFVLSNSSPLDDDVISFETATTVLQIGLLGLLIVISALIAFPFLRQPKPFYCVFGIFALGVVSIPYALLKRNPLMWIFQLFTRDHISLGVLSFWLVCSFCGVVTVWLQSSTAQKASTSQRKVFHFLAVVVFAVGLLYAPDIMYLASGVILAVFVLLEAVRILQIPPLSEFLLSGFNVFADDKDGDAALTPLYLLAGVAVPLWISPVNNIPIPKSELLPFFSGILSIGVGDSIASFVGSHFGRMKWPGSNRTVEGSTACFLSQLFSVVVMIHFGILPESVPYLRTICAVGAVSLIEAKTDQVDNLALPLVLYILLV